MVTIPDRATFQINYRSVIRKYIRKKKRLNNKTENWLFRFSFNVTYHLDKVNALVDGVLLNLHRELCHPVVTGVLDTFEL